MTDAPNLNDITDLTNSQKVAGQSLLSGQSAEDADYLKRYTDFINGQEGASAMAKRIGGELGIPTLQANATMLQNTLTNLPGTYTKAVQGYDVNENQRQRIIAQKAGELQPMVTTAENSLSGAETNLGQQMGYEQTDQQKALLPYQTEKDLLDERQARETTMFTTENESELNGLIAKINAGVTLSEGEKNRAATLASQESSYLNAKETASSATQIVEVGGRKQLINSQTGAVVQDLGPSSAGTGTTKTESATQSAINTMMSAAGGDKSKMWNWIHQWEPELASQGVDTSRLWALYNTS